jgi:6-pyruvoyltetrahydropterin/6-carboxytetrahydropterin synthase
MFVSTKTYGPEKGFAVAYRQWRAESHCKFIHGYAMGFHFEFETPCVDARNWCIDFGGLGPLKDLLEQQFDHTLLVAQDDPEYDKFMELDRMGLAQVREVERTGCEGLSKALYDYVNEIFLPDYGRPDVHCRKVVVRETPTNSAWYERDWKDSAAYQWLLENDPEKLQHA